MEVACGTGVVFKKIVALNPNGQNIGIYLSPDMLEKAKSRLKKSKFSNYELKEGDVLNLDFEENSFDLIVNNFMVDLMPADTFDKIAEVFYGLTKPNVSVTAPGFVGSITAMNNAGLAMGVNMVCSVLTNVLKPGLNSLLLVRKTVQSAENTEEGIQKIVKAPRGVTWLYPIGDREGRSAIVEAGKKTLFLNTMKYQRRRTGKVFG